MNAKTLLIALVFVSGIFSCKKPEPASPLEPVINGPTLAEVASKYADEHPSIAGETINFNNPKSVKVVILGALTVWDYSFKYDLAGKLMSISEENGSTVAFSSDTTTRKATRNWGGKILEYQLNQQGFAIDTKGLLNEIQTKSQYFYKNGYLVSMSNPLYITRLRYTNDGDILEWTGVNHTEEKTQFIYQYTEHPNTIRQEITRWATPHFSYRGDFLGKYSTHLLKQAVIKSSSGSGSDITFDFSYTFDSQGRVSTMTIKRSLGPDVVYQYSY